MTWQEAARGIEPRHGAHVIEDATGNPLVVTMLLRDTVAGECDEDGAHAWSRGFAFNLPDAPLAVEAEAPPEPETLHIERTPADLNNSIAVMYCGATCWLDETGVPTPSLDWYSAPSGATCKPCLTAYHAEHQ